MIRRFTIEPGQGLTEEQLKEIEDARNHPILFDEDCEELSPAMMKAFNNEVGRDRIRMVRIPNTLEIGESLISESMMEDAGKNPRIEVLSGPKPMEFDGEGNLIRE